MSGISSSTLNYYRAAGSIPRSISDKNLPFYISAGNITISGQDPNLLWVQSSLTPTSGSMFRLWNLQMVMTSYIIDPSVPFTVVLDMGFPLTFKEGLPLTGNFSVSSSSQLYNAFRYWTVQSVGNDVILSFIPSTLPLAKGSYQFFLNFLLLTNLA